MKLLFILLLPCLLLACKDDSPNSDASCPVGLSIVSEFVNPDGQTVRVYADGKAYFVSDAECTFVAQYYDADFYDQTYNITDSGVYLIVGKDTYLAPFRNQTLDFEGLTNALDLFRLELEQEDRLLTSFTLQSPAAPSVTDYVTLRNCILEGTCDFIDNRFELAADPSDGSNTVLKFFSVAPSASMITAKASVSTTLAYFEKGDDFWFEARYFITDYLPTTLADFESSHFVESPGPRIILRGDRLAIENKFNEKLTFDQPESTTRSLPLNQWVTVKVHLSYDPENGVVQVWQDDVLIIDRTGPTMPLDFWIQDRIEFGITATARNCTLLVDDVRFSDQEF